MLTLLDSSVVSEQATFAPDANVLGFLRQLNPVDVLLSSITFGELHSGVELLPDGRRKRGLADWLSELTSHSADRVVPVDLTIALAWGRVHAEIGRTGHSLTPADGLIAATALVDDMTLATRNIRHFERTGV